jgi:hypothetical protein
MGRKTADRIVAKAERAIGREQRRGYQAAANQAAKSLRGDGGLLVHDQLNEAVADSQRKRRR